MTIPFLRPIALLLVLSPFVLFFSRKAVAFSSPCYHLTTKRGRGVSFPSSTFFSSSAPVAHIRTSRKQTSFLQNPSPFSGYATACFSRFRCCSHCTLKHTVHWLSLESRLKDIQSIFRIAPPPSLYLPAKWGYGMYVVVGEAIS
jgi:hypothetical protein